MGQVVDAVGVQKHRATSNAGIQKRLRIVEGDMLTLRAQLESQADAAKKAHEELHVSLNTVLDRLGKAADGDGQKATGLFALIEALDKRLRPVEKRWEQMKGGVATAAVILGPSAALIWFLAGDKVSRLLHG